MNLSSNKILVSTIPVLYTPGQLTELCQRHNEVPFVVDDLLRAGSIACLVGRSGLGKSAFLYQLCVSVAAGVPFLGHNTRQGKAIYFDFENGLAQVDTMIKTLSQFQGLASPPEQLLCCNANDPEASSTITGNCIPAIIRKEEPALVVIDSLSAAFPGAEEKNSAASETLATLREAARSSGTSVVFVHHLRKANVDSSFYAPRLGVSDIQSWFAQVRGASALINNADIRLGIEDDGGGNEELLIVRGFARVSGEIPAKLIERVIDDEGNPTGYRPASAIKTLSLSDQNVYGSLPDEFRFKDVLKVSGLTNKPTNDLLKRLQAAGVVRKLERSYLKVADSPMSLEQQELEELRPQVQHFPQLSGLPARELMGTM